MDSVPCVPGFAAGCGCGWHAAQGAAVFVLLVACLLRCGSPGGKGATGVIVMMYFVCIFESLRIVRPLFVLFVGQMFTCTDANADSWF